MSEELRFNPPQGLDSLSITLLSSHSLCIHRIHPEDGGAGTPVPVRFRKEAIAQGCAPVGVDVEHEQEEGETKSQLILAAIEAVVARGDAGDLEADGSPKLAAVKKEAGFSVTKAEFEAAFEVFKLSLV